MTDPHQHQTPPAWYPDPDPNNPGGQRWWDGARWTEHSRPAVPAPQPLYDAGQDARPPVAPHPTPAQPGYGQPAQPAPALREPARPSYPPSAAQPGYAPAPAPAYGPGGYAGGAAPAFPPVKPGTSALTWPVWLVVGLPLLTTIAYMFVDFTSYFRAVIALSASGANPGGAEISHLTSTMSGFIVGALLVDVLGFVVYGLGVMFAYFDWRELGRRGFVRPFHWAWAFLTLVTFGIPFVYVIGRTVVSHRRGGKDALWPVWALVAVIVIGIVLIVIKVVMIVGVISSTIGTSAPGVS
ncbi:hypothetical protein GCM10028798_26050 [Humibacter antri]